MTAIIQPNARGAMFAASPAPANFQIAWDSTSLGLLKECPRKYYYTIILGYKPKRESVHLKFGLLYHGALEAYDHFACSIGKLDGNLTNDEHNTATRAALRRAFTMAGTYEPPRCTACHGAGFLPRTGHESPAELLAPPETCELCGGSGASPHDAPEWRTWESTDPHKNMYTLARTVTLYADTFRNSPMRTVELASGKPAVEVSFAFEVGAVNGINYSLAGHLDRIAHNPQAGERPAPHDRKTTKNQLNNTFWRQFAPHNQFSLYTTACAVHYDLPPNGLTVDAAQVTPNGNAFARQFIPYPPQLINEWLGETQTWVSLAYQFAEAGNWPRNDKSCGNYGGCAFQSVCSKADVYRQDWLDADFEYNPWNPLETRGDI